MARQKKNKGAILFLGKIRAGFQNLIEDTEDIRISLDKKFEINSPNTFLFNVSGDSMTDLGIYEGDMVVVKKGEEIEDKDIVVANIDGIYTIKIYRKTKTRVYLQAANSDYENMYPKFKLEIFGKVTGLVREI